MAVSLLNIVPQRHKAHKEIIFIVDPL